MNLDLRHHWKTYVFFIVVALFSVVGLTTSSHTAEASHRGGCPFKFNRCVGHTYFNNAQYSGNGTYVMSTGAPSGDAGLNTPNVDSFVSTIRARLDDADSSSRDRYQDSTGAAMIINTMLGHNGSDFADRNAGVVNARSEFGTWERRVRDHAARGLVDFNVASRTIPAGTTNSLYDRTNQDDYFYTYDGDTQNLIVFKNTDGSDRYVIKKNCGNPIGDLQPLLESGSNPYGVIDVANCDFIAGWAKDDDDLSQPVHIGIHFQNQRTGEITTGYSGPAGNCREAAVGCHGFHYNLDARYKNGDSYLVWVDADNIGAGAGPVRIGERTIGPCTSFNIEMTLSGNPASLRIEPGQTFSVISTLNNTGTRDSDPGTAVLDGDSNADSYASPTNPSFGYPSIGPGGIHQQVSTFTLSESAPDRALICFTGSASPKTGSGGTETSNTLCFTVYVPRRPYVSIYGGDVHAGAVLSIDGGHNCVGSPGTGEILGRTNGGNGSRSQYGLSAIELIRSFGSNNNPSATGLTFGNNGTLGNLVSRVICRPNYMLMSATRTTEPSSTSTINITPYANAHNGEVVYWAGTNQKTINGGNIPPGRRLTILSEGPVVIAGDIQYHGLGNDDPNYSSRDQIPSLMVVSASNIGIRPAVARLNGYFVANGTISTCADGADSEAALKSPTIFNNTGGTSTCNRQLQVYGLIEATTLYFRRTFGDVRNGDPNLAAELFRLSPEMYLVAPPGLGGGELQYFFDADLPPIN